jgi:hypothetical protein
MSHKICYHTEFQGATLKCHECHSASQVAPASILVLLMAGNQEAQRWHGLMVTRQG